MKPESQPRLFRYDQKLTALAGTDPSLTLLDKDNSYALLLAEGARQDSYSGTLFLETVSLVRPAVRWPCREIPEVALVERDGLWLAEDTSCGENIAAASSHPFTVVFISKEDYERLKTFKNQQTVGPIVEFARQFFKTLPAFPASLPARVPPRRPSVPGHLEGRVVVPDGAPVITMKMPIIVRKLADKLNRKPYQLIADLIQMKVLAHINQAIDEKTARRLCAKYGFRLQVRFDSN